MYSAFGVDHGTDQVSKGLLQAGRAALKPVTGGATKSRAMGIRMGTPQMATNAATKNFSHARKGGAGVMSSLGTGFKAGFRAAPGTTLAAGAGTAGAVGLGTGYALNRN